MEIVMEVPLVDYLNALDASVDGYEFEYRTGKWVGFCLESMYNAKLRDSGVAELIKSIQENGFVTPICGYVDGLNLYQGNGHHRLAVAILLCLDTIPVVFTDEEYMATHITECDMTVTDADKGFLALFLED